MSNKFRLITESARRISGRFRSIQGNMLYTKLINEYTNNNVDAMYQSFREHMSTF